MAALALAACGKAGNDGESPARLRFSILPTEPAATLQQNWQPVLTDMEKATGLKVKPFFSTNYSVLIEAMRFKQTDVGWFSNESGLEAVRRADGEVFARTFDPSGVDGYNSVLIVGAKSGLTLDRVLKCDKSLSFGQADPLSTSGTLAPMAYLFGDHDVQPEKCFKQVRSGQSHQTNLFAVANGQLDVATNNTTGLKLNRQRGQPQADQVKVIWTSPTLPEDPIIWRKDLDPAIKEKLRQFFLLYGQGDTPEAARQRANLKPSSASAASSRPTTTTSCPCARWRPPRSGCWPKRGAMRPRSPPPASPSTPSPPSARPWRRAPARPAGTQ